MAIDFGDQGLVDSGRSSVGIPDTYVPIRGGSGAGDNAEALARALSGLSNTMNYVEDEQTKKQIAQKEFYVSQVAASLDEKTPDDAITDVTSKLYPKAAAAVADSVGITRGRSWVLEQVAALDNSDVLDPTELQARYDTIRGKALEIAGQSKNDFYRGGFMQSVENFLSGKQDTDYDALIKRQNQNHKEAMQTVTSDSIDAILDGRSPPDDIGGNNEVQSMFNGGKGAISARAQNIDYTSVGSFDDITTALMGKSEVKDAGTLSAFFKKTLGVDINPAEVPWCAAFVGGILESQGVESTKSLAARSYLKFGKATDTPTKGDIVVLSRGSDPNKGHVGFFVGFDADGNPKILGGNQNDTVSIKTYDKDTVLGYRTVPKMGKVITALNGRDADGFPAPVENASADDTAYFKPFQVASASDEIIVSGGEEEANAPVTVQTQPQLQGGETQGGEEVLSPKVLMIRRALFGADSRYGKATPLNRPQRRDAIAETLMQKALDRRDPSIMYAMPKEMRTDDITQAFNDTREKITRLLDVDENRRQRFNEDADKAARQEAESAMVKAAQEGKPFDPFEAATYKYTDASGKTVERRDVTLLNYATALTKRDSMDEAASVEMAFKLQDKLDRAYRTGNWKEVFADDPTMLAAIGDKAAPSDLDVKTYILRSGMNRDQWTGLLNALPEMKNNFKIMADPVVSSRYDDVLGFQVKSYLQGATMIKKMAGVDADINAAVSNLGISVKRTFDESYFQQYKAWKSRPENAGSAEPTYEEKLKMLDTAEQRAMSIFNSQRDWIEKTASGEITADIMQPGTQISTSYEGKPVTGQVLADNGTLVIVRGADGQDYALPKNTLTQSPNSSAAPAEGQVRPFTQYDQSIQESQPDVPVSNETPIDENAVGGILDAVVPPVMNFMSTVGQGLSSAYNTFEEAAKYKVNPKRLDTTSQKAIEVEKAVTDWANNPANAEQANKLIEEASTPMRKDRDYAILYNRWNDATDIQEKMKARDDLDNFMKKYRLDYIYKKISN